MAASQNQPQKPSPLERLFHLESSELGHILPFFGLYLILFMGLTLADGLSLALFVQQVGAEQLPACYALTGTLNLLGIAAYLWAIRRFNGVNIFRGILASIAAIYLLVWAAARMTQLGRDGYALLFVGREMAYTLILMHFGTFLLDYFRPEQLRRVLPVIYAGGRLGGIAGGFVLQTLAEKVELIDLALLFVAIFCLGIFVLTWFGRIALSRPMLEPATEAAPPTDPREAAAANSVWGFLRYVWHCRLLFWITVTSLLFVVCRWLLSFQYSSQFEAQFADSAAMAQFLGKYTQIALIVSLLLQLTLVSRLVAWIGLCGAHLVYGILLLCALGGNLIWLALPTAVFSRFVETELRFGLRNPVAQMFLNQFSRTVRVQVRAWSLGFIIPVATLATAILLARLPHWTGPDAVPWFGAASGLTYLAASLALYFSYAQFTQASATSKKSESSAPSSS